MLLFESSFDPNDLQKTSDGGGGGGSGGGLSAVAVAAASVAVSTSRSDDQQQLGRYLVRWICQQADLWLLLYRCGEILARVHGPLERSAERVEELLQQMGGDTPEYNTNNNNNNYNGNHEHLGQEQNSTPSLAQRLPFWLPWVQQGINLSS
jgi:hypothetical protein